MIGMPRERSAEERMNDENEIHPECPARFECCVTTFLEDIKMMSGEVEDTETLKSSN